MTTKNKRRSKPILKSLSAFERREVEYLPGDHFQLPRGYLTLLVGDTDAGKSFIALNRIAELSHIPLKTIIITEDEVSSMVRPRVEDMEGDLEQIKILTGVKIPHSEGEPISVQFFFNETKSKDEVSRFWFWDSQCENPVVVDVKRLPY